MKYSNTESRDNRSFKKQFYDTGCEQKLAPTTIYRYWRWVRRLIFSQQPYIHPQSLADWAVIDFITKLEKKGLHRRSVVQAIDALSFLYRHVIRRRAALLKELKKLRKQICKQRLIRTTFMEKCGVLFQMIRNKIL